MKTKMMMATLLAAAFAGAAEVRLDHDGRVNIPSLDVTMRFSEHLKGWRGVASSHVDWRKVSDAKGRSRWNLSANGREPLLGSGSTVLKADGAAAAFAFEVEFNGDRESEAAVLSVDLPAAVFAGGSWDFGKGGRKTFPAAFDGKRIQLGGDKTAAVELTAKDGRRLRFEFAGPLSVQLQDSRKWGDGFSLRIGGRGKGVRKGEKRAYRGRLVLSEPCEVVSAKPFVISEENGWTPLDYRKDIVAGSALDFSNQRLVDAPAGKHGWLRNVDGHFEFENLPGVKQRFYGVNLCFTANFPDHETADALVVRLKRLGYNTIRVHHYERDLVDGHDKGMKDGFDAGACDRIDYLLAKAIENGFYITTDLFVSRPVTWASIGLGERGKGVVKNKNLYKSLVALWDPAFAEWCRFSEKFLLHRNPYTGRRYVDEPAMPLISLVNEGQHTMGWSREEEPSRSDPIVRRAWKAWLAERRKADPGFCPDAPADSEEVNAYDRHNAAFAHFMADTERKSAERMVAFLRKLGSKALFTNANCGPHFTPMQQVREDCYGYVDDHFYVDHPNFLVHRWQLPSKCGNGNPVKNLHLPPTRVAFTRLASKPFTITEWNFSGPGMYRGVGGIMTGAFSALQDWDGLWRFAYSHSRETLKDGAGFPGYFDVGADPLGQASDRASVCLFLRRDLAPLEEAETYRVDAPSLTVGGGAAVASAPKWEAQSWYRQVSTSVEGSKVRPGTTVRKISETHAAKDAPFACRENAAFALDRDRGSFRIVTPRTAGGFAPEGTMACGPVGFTLKDAPATVWASSVDAEPTDIRHARRLVVTHLTDVQARGNVYADEAKQVLLRWGKLPPLVRNGSAEITLELETPERYEVWALETSGRRLERIPSAVKDGRLAFTASVKGPNGARMIYEVARAPEPTGCPAFTVETPRETGGPVLKAADFGLDAKGERNATAINRALAEAKRVKASRLELAPGTYRCFDEPGVVIDGFRDFTFDGKGAVLVFRRPAEYRGQPQSELIMEKGNLLVKECERVQVCGFTMDWDWERDPLAAFVRVADRHVDRAHGEESYVDLAFVDYERYPLYPAPVPVQKLMGMDECRTRFFTRKGGMSCGQTEGHFGAKNEWVKPNVLRVWPCVPMPGRNQNPATGFRFSADGNRKRVEAMEQGGLYRLHHCYYGKNGINLLANRHLTVRDVTVWSSFGMAMVTDGPQEYWQVENFRVVPPDEAAFAAAYPGVRYFHRPVSSTSDGHHVARSKGHCRYVNCTWSLNNDDTSNFHDRFTIAVKCGAKKLQIVNKRGADYFRAAAGAPIELRYPNFDATGFTAKLVRTQGEVLELDREIPEQKGPCFLVWDRTYGTDNVEMKGCRFVDGGFRNLFSPSNLTVEDCAFVRTFGPPCQFIADYRANLWCEGLGATNLVVRNCRFEDACTSSPLRAQITALCVTPDGWEIPPPDKGFVAGGTLIEGCTFTRPRGPVLDFKTGRGVIFRDSTVDLRGVSPEFKDAGAIKTDGAEGVSVSGIKVVRDL